MVSGSDYVDLSCLFSSVNAGQGVLIVASKSPISLLLGVVHAIHAPAKVVIYARSSNATSVRPSQQ
jgi:hypothetical protein